MTRIRSGRLVAFVLAAGTAGGVLGLLGASHAVAAETGADLSITKVGPTPTADGRFSYQITVKNNGPDPSSGWIVFDPMVGPVFLDAPGDIRSSDPRCQVVASSYHGNLPQKTLRCDGGPLAAGSSTVIEVTAGDNRVNHASVDGNEPDSNPDNDRATSVPVESGPLIDPVVGAGAAAVALATGGAVRLVRRSRMSA
ncbi:DUF11 domain-containing protein [Streptomyces shenzhenensis]|uniref:DUF11 domain-containing protein n=1 Tax=Streptomyces shenzhenensis TaxID=943815 RepID=UPI0033F5DD7D